MGIPMSKITWLGDHLVSYTRVYQTSTGCLRMIYPSLGIRQLFWWCHNGPVTSQLTNPIKWPNYPLQLIWIYVHINTHKEESLTQRYRRLTNVQLCLKFLYDFSLNGWHALFVSQITVTTSPLRHMQLSATSLYGWWRWDTRRNADVPVF